MADMSGKAVRRILYKRYHGFRDSLRDEELGAVRKRSCGHDHDQLCRITVRISGRRLHRYYRHQAYIYSSGCQPRLHRCAGVPPAEGCGDFIRKIHGIGFQSLCRLCCKPGYSVAIYDPVPRGSIAVGTWSHLLRAVLQLLSH